MELTKTFNIIDHELLIAKLLAYGFSIELLEIISSYLHSRKKRVNINTNSRSWAQLI